MCKSFLAILFSLSSLAWSEGFGDGTVVKTPNGYENISQLKAGDLVLSCDFKNNCVEREVIQTHQTMADGYLEIKVGNATLKVSEDHLFYDPQTASWVEAKNILTSSEVMSASYEKLTVKDVRYISQKVILYNLSVAEHHNFYVGQEDILVHNFLFLVAAVPIGILIPEIVVTVGSIIGLTAIAVKITAPIAVTGAKIVAASMAGASQSHQSSKTKSDERTSSSMPNAEPPKNSEPNKEPKKESQQKPDATLTKEMQRQQ